MKSVKTIIVALALALGLTGCYTQLQYSQGVSRVADGKYSEGYAWDGNAEDSAEYYQDEEGGYATSFYYKDYDKANWWSSCYCSPYIGSSYHSNNHWYDHYSRFHYGYAGFHDPYYFSSSWRWRHFGLGFHHNFFAFDMYWGSPFYAYRGFLYGPYWGGYYHYPYRYGYGYYYGGYYGSDGSKSNTGSRTYRPRSIGADRVANVNNRGDSRDRSVTRQSSSTQARGIRSTGSTRVNRGAVQQGTTRVQQPVTRGTNRVDTQSSRPRSGSNERVRGAVQERSGTRHTSSSAIRSRGAERIDHTISNPAAVDDAVIRSRISRQRAVQPKADTDNNRSSFFGRVGKILNSSTPDNSIRIYRSINNDSSVRSNNIFRPQTRTRSTTISRPRSTTSRPTITRSSSNSSPRSRATSNSSSRSSSSRSRGN